jgi:hypothetical protein
MNYFMQACRNDTIEQGADVNAMNNSGKPPMSNAAGYLPSGKIAADILKKHGARPY